MLSYGFNIEATKLGHPKSSEHIDWSCDFSEELNFGKELPLTIDYESKISLNQFVNICIFLFQMFVIFKAVKYHFFK